MNIQPDFEELLLLLEEHHVEYLIVGGYAVAFHGLPRFTKDIDIFYSAAPKNIAKLKSALQAFGFGHGELSDELFTTAGNIITFGIEPVRVDIINEISGVTFAEAWKHREEGMYGKCKTKFIGRIELIKNKSSTVRLQDKADIDKLRKQSAKS
jgi:hypothetical protein